MRTKNNSFTAENLRNEIIKSLASEFREWAKEFNTVAEVLESGVIPDKFKATQQSLKIRDLYGKCNKLRDIVLQVGRRNNTP